MGKTALVDVFAERVGGRHDVLVGRGVDGRRVRDVLRTVAPTWLLQLSGVVEPADLDALRAGAVGMSAERMLREVGVALEVRTAERPVVLILEDLHHSDRSTTEVLAYLAQRRDPARLLIVGTYRPAEVASRSHPLRQVVRDLRAQNTEPATRARMARTTSSWSRSAFGSVLARARWFFGVRGSLSDPDRRQNLLNQYPLSRGR